MQTAGYTQEEEVQIRLFWKTSKKNKLMKTRLASTRMRVNKKQLMIRSVSHVLLNMVETMLCYRNEWLPLELGT